MNTLSSSLPYTISQEASVQDYIALLKPRVMALVIFTGAVGMFLAPGSHHPFLTCFALLCLATGAGASAVLNMVWDRDIDLLMSRTRTRPIPAGRVDPSDALVLGICLSILSVMMMALTANYTAALWLAITILFYSVFYTLILKRNTSQNIVIGGAAGALPPVIGWACITGSVTHPLPWILFGIIFLWTPPHFWALALVQQEDYRKANVPMLPVIAGPISTIHQMALYTILLFGVSLLPYVLGYAGALYGIGALSLGCHFGKSMWTLWKTRSHFTPEQAKKVFWDSILYLFGLFLALACDRLWA